jgi:hypothetical protein
MFRDSESTVQGTKVKSKNALNSFLLSDSCPLSDISEVRSLKKWILKLFEDSATISNRKIEMINAATI